MVLLESPTLNIVCSGVASQYHILKNYKVNLFFNLPCKQFAMSSIPFSAFSAGRIRDTQRDMKISNITKNKDASSKYYNTSVKELSPLQYNSKLMNSIWGIYNRYSPHNVKKINDANVFAGEMQQSAAISPRDSVLSLPAAINKVWASFNVSQSH